MTTRSWRVLAVFIAVVAACCGVAATCSATVRHKLSLSVNRQPDDFPELFFLHPADLPHTYAAGSAFRATAGITNVSADAHDYSYRVDGGTASSSVVLQHGVVDVSAGGTTLIPLAVLPPSGTRQLTVTLYSQDGHSSLTIRALVAEREGS